MAGTTGAECLQERAGQDGIPPGVRKNAMSLKVAIESVLKERTGGGKFRVRAVGGTTLGGGRWMLLENQAINAIERGRSEFFVHKDDRQVLVVVGVASDGAKYLKTVEDQDQPDALLALPDYNSKF